MERPDTPTLLQTALAASGFEHDAERGWAFLLFTGVVESAAHDDYLEALGDLGHDALEVADALLEFATRRAETLDPDGALALQLRQYFEVGATLAPAHEDEGTDPGS